MDEIVLSAEARRELKGVPASRGVAAGRALFLPSFQGSVPKRRLAKEEVRVELERFDAAIVASRFQLRELIALSHLAEEHQAIFDAQILLLEDPMFVEDVRGRIREHNNSEYALAGSIDHFRLLLRRTGNDYFDERISDIEDVGNRLLANLMGVDGGDIRIPFVKNLPSDAILLADEISPSLMLNLRGGIAGLATVRGGITGHTAILARDRGIPTLVGVDGLIDQVRNGEPLLIDCEKGRLIVHPDDAELRELRRRREFDLSQHDATYCVRSPVVLACGAAELESVELWVNMDDADDVSDGRASGVHGIGLFRTEFIYLRDPFLFDSPEEQRRIYRRVLKQMRGRPVTFRMLDMGDDKQFHTSFVKFLSVRNETLKELRGIRFLLANPKILELQLMAILHAAIESGVEPDNCRLMLPMASTIEEVAEFRQLLAMVSGDLERELGVSIPDYPLGVMLETPAAVMMADIFSKHVDFCSIGSNDLAQYTMAISRHMAYTVEYQFYQPSVFRMIAEAVARSTVPLSICGELASIPGIAPLLIGLGLRRLSVSLSAVRNVAETLSSLDPALARSHAEELLECETAAEVESLIKRPSRCSTAQLV